MPSLIPGFEYDVFISYRQNDNRSGWVTEFVKNLEEELAATIKQRVSVYFDSNSYDGLLETHNVDKSLENKLKAVVLIPILSQTYCDTKCFAWQHEFVEFCRLSREGSLERDVKLSNGNVASRILPIKIHDLDADDKKLVETEMGSVLRSVEFIFRSPGVNRPLTSNDKREENTSKTFYRDQLNKVANAIKEILFAVTHENKNFVAIDNPATHASYRENKSFPKKAIGTLVVATVLIAIIYFIYARQDKKGLLTPPSVNKSIAVLPLVNMSDDKEQEYFSDGLTEEIINRLAGLPQLRVMARTSSFAFKGKNLPIQKIADSLGVTYVVEGSVRRAERKLKVTVQLIRTSDGTHIWSKTYDQVLEDVFKIQDDIATSVARSLDIYLDDEKKELMFYTGTRNVEAYEYFLQGKAEFVRNHSSAGGSLWKANSFFAKALEHDSTFATAYWFQHDAFMHDLFSSASIIFKNNADEVSPAEGYAKMNMLIDKAIYYTPNPSIQNMYRLAKSFYSENWTNLPLFINRFLEDKEAPKMVAYSETVLGPYALILSGQGANLFQICNEAVNYDPMQPTIWQRGVYAALSTGELEKASEFALRGRQAIGENYSRISELSLALGQQKEILKSNSIDAFHVIALVRDGHLKKAKSVADSLYSANPGDVVLIWAFDELDDREKANKIAAEIDKIQLGTVQLAMLTSLTYNLDHLIVDLHHTPNFSKRLSEAGIDLENRNVNTH